ncbi:redoxin domain-containing protein [Streptomyces sp. NPDC059874]|uniref:redoxin domain-containing protein n=1 Tax=Streptomyces sp. NPDC059874 TaxID=3346983 RepID=UPI00365767E9
MRLEPGRKAPDIEGSDVSSGSVSPRDLVGRTVILKFYRFAACPICNLHVRELVRRAGELEAAGVVPVAVLHSPAHRLRKSLDGYQVPFTVIADPEKCLFRAYGVESSLGGMFTGAVARDYGRAMRAGIFCRPIGHEGGVQGHPADFLIDSEGVLRPARYGRDYADTMGVDAVLDAATAMRAHQPS